MRPEKVEIYIDGQVKVWVLGGEISPLIVNENQRIKIIIYYGKMVEMPLPPRIDVEDYSIQLHLDDINSIEEDGYKNISFSSFPEKIFRESFGIAFVRLFLADQEFILPFEVLATKVTAIEAEQMIRYLTEKREHIIRVCLSRTLRPTGTKDDGRPDPEMILSTAEKIIDTFLDSRSEFRQHIRSKLIPTTVPAWKAEQSGSLIDPVDVICNLDSLRPGDGRQDVILRGRTYSTSAIDITALVKDTNVEENIVLIGGLYSIRRVISQVMHDLDAAFKNYHIPAYDKEYVSFGELMIKLTGGAMYKRCESVISSAENIIRMFESDFGIKFSGENRPRITPYVRSSRLYRNLFEQYDYWYSLGTPSLEGTEFLIKLRSLSKIFELFVLFRIFDYLLNSSWKVVGFSLSEEWEKLIPAMITFKKGEIVIKLDYEPKILTFDNKIKPIQHMGLLKINNPNHPDRNFNYGKWTPDYTICVKKNDGDIVNYLILDAKYSTPYRVGETHIKNIYDKYYDHMGVFNKSKNSISRNEIIGIFAVFPEDIEKPPNIVNMRDSKFSSYYSKFSIESHRPTMMPMVAGLPISFNEDVPLMEKWLDKALGLAMTSLSAPIFLDSAQSAV